MEYKNNLKLAFFGRNDNYSVFVYDLTFMENLKCEFLY